ncbi:replication protein [Acinetobacter pittii]|uniref:replication protein n=1 Tax=Acinetobacter pittii TaxID=48296 RepID=UPI0030161A12
MNLAHKHDSPQGEVIRFPKHEHVTMSKIEKGYTRLPNMLIDDLVMAQISDKAFKCLMLIIRQTVGFDRESNNISITQFQTSCGIKKRDTVISVIKELEDSKIIRVDRKKGCWNIFFFTPNQYQQTGLVPPKGTSPAKGDGTSTTEQDGTSPAKWDTTKESNKEKRKEEESTREVAPSQPQNRPLNFVQYHSNDRVHVSLLELTRKYPAQLDFQNQAKTSFPNHTADQIFAELKKLAQWSLDKSQQTPQGWMNTWLKWMQKVPTATEVQKSESKKPQASSNSQPAKKPRHRYGQGVVGGNSYE